MPGTDITEAVQEMARDDDPNQVARILDEALAGVELRVFSGYNDKGGYYLVEED